MLWYTSINSGNFLTSDVNNDYLTADPFAKILLRINPEVLIMKEKYPVTFHSILMQTKRIESYLRSPRHAIAYIADFILTPR